MGNSTTSKVIGKGTIQFRLMMNASLLFKTFVIFPNQGTISSLGALQGECFSFSTDGDLMEVSKEAHVKFQAERVDNVYMLQNSKVTVGGLQLFSASKVVVWNNQRLQWFRDRMFSCTMKRD